MVWWVLTKNNSRRAGFQYLNSTKLSTGTKASKQCKSFKVQKASMVGLLYVCVWNVFQTPASKVKDFLQKSKPFDKGLLVDIMGYQKSDKS